MQANHLFGIAAPGQREGVAYRQREIAEHLLPLLHFEESRIREPDAGEIGGLVGGREPHQSIGLVIGQRPQEHGVDDAEERDVGANAERETDHGDEGEPRRLEQLTKGGAEHGRHEELVQGAIDTHIVHRPWASEKG